MVQVLDHVLCQSEAVLDANTLVRVSDPAPDFGVSHCGRILTS